jgi:Flp pilus assembly protein CpaB
VAVRDVPAGEVLGTADVAVVRRTPSELPQGTLANPSAAVGRTVGSGVRTGEALTDARLVGPGLLAGRPRGQVAAPVRIADGEAAALLRPGDRVDVLQASGGEGVLGPAGGGGVSARSGAAGDDGAPAGSRAGDDGTSARSGAAGNDRTSADSRADSPAARTVVRRATVLARPGGPASDGGLLPDADPSVGGLLVLAVDEQEAAELAEAAARGPLSVVLR